jgi:nucleotide-binding universal stress UspA family protein
MAAAVAKLNRGVLMKVLIGYDGSESSKAIFDDLRLAGLPTDTEARVVTVADLITNAGPVSEFDLQSLASQRVEAALRRAEAHRVKAREEADETANSAVERLRSSFPEWNLEGQVRMGTPMWELLDATDEWEPDLVVVGSQGRSAIGRFFLGSVSKKLSTDARSSVRVVRPSERTDPAGPPRIIIGVDGSPAAEEAIYAVGQRVWPAATEVRLVAVDDGVSTARISVRLPQVAEMVNSYLEKRESRVTAMLDWATEQFNAIGMTTSVFTTKGDAKNILLEQAEEWKADSIFVGTRDFKSAFERFRLGSVSTAIVTNAVCTVEIVRPSADTES